MGAVKAGVSACFLSGNTVCSITPYPFPMTGPNDAQLIGAPSSYPFNGGGEWTMAAPDHWFFAGVGWELHGDTVYFPGLEFVAEGYALNSRRRKFPKHILPWSRLVRPHGPDAQVQRITRNTLGTALRPRP